MAGRNAHTHDYEWSFPVAADEINANRPVTYRIVANAAQRIALSERFGVASIEHVEATITLSREQGGLVVHADGKFEVDLTQNCVITLEPIKSHLAESFEGYFADPEQAINFAKAKARREEAQKASFHEAPVMDEKDDPEPIMDGQIDLGELAAQYISLAIDPYPQKEDARFDTKKAKAEDSFSPFSVLKKLKK